MYSFFSGNITGIYPNIVSDYPHLNKEVLTRNIVISTSCGAILGSIIYIYSDSKKKSSFVFGDLMLIFGSVILYFSKHEHYLYFARAFIGFGSGILTVAGPVLIGEACSRKARGAVVATGGFMLNVGIYFSSLLVNLTPLVSDQLIYLMLIKMVNK